MASRSRGFCFTKNNYANSPYPTLLGLGAKYLVYGREVAPTTGTPHLQGYVAFANAKTISAVRKLLPGCHITKAAGDSAQNRTYCIKDGDFEEFGGMLFIKLLILDRPATQAEKGDSEKERWDGILAAAKTGRIDEIDSEVLIRHYNTLKRIKRDYMEAPADLEPVAGANVWIHGPPGTGKSRSVRQQILREDLYDKSINKWWMGYQGEDVVLIDDIGLNHVHLGDFIKRWADVYSFPAEDKCGGSQIRPKRIIITSNYKPSQIWLDQVLCDAISRRFRIVEKLELNIAIEL